MKNPSVQLLWTFQGSPHNAMDGAGAVQSPTAMQRLVATAYTNTAMDAVRITLAPARTGKTMVLVRAQAGTLGIDRVGYCKVYTSSLTHTSKRKNKALKN